MSNNADGSITTILNGLITGSIKRNDLKKIFFIYLILWLKLQLIDKLFLNQKKIINITNNTIEIKIFDNIYQKSAGISYENCKDEDSGENPKKINTNTWIKIYINCVEEQLSLVRIRYSSKSVGFGVSFSKYGEILGKITNLENTGNLQK